MEHIWNLLSLTEEERAAFQAAAQGADLHFAAAGDLTAEDWAQATAVLGNPPAAALKGARSLKWLQTRSAGVDAYAAPGVLPEGAALTSASGAYGHSVSEHMLAMLLALMKRLPAYRDQQNGARWQDLGPVRTLAGAQVLVVGAGDLGSSFAVLCRALGSPPPECGGTPPGPPPGWSACTASTGWTSCSPRRTWWPSCSPAPRRPRGCSAGSGCCG